MSSWLENPIAFPPKSPKARDSWWTRPDVQTDRAAFQRLVVANEIERLNKRSSFYTHDKFPAKQKHVK